MVTICHHLAIQLTPVNPTDTLSLNPQLPQTESHESVVFGILQGLKTPKSLDTGHLSLIIAGWNAACCNSGGADNPF
jgi:hypothetical protein